MLSCGTCARRQIRSIADANSVCRADLGDSGGGADTRNAKAALRDLPAGLGRTADGERSHLRFLSSDRTQLLDTVLNSPQDADDACWHSRPRWLVSKRPPPSWRPLSFPIRPRGASERPPRARLSQLLLTSRNRIKPRPVKLDAIRNGCTRVEDLSRPSSACPFGSGRQVTGRPCRIGPPRLPFCALQTVRKQSPALDPHHSSRGFETVRDGGRPSIRPRR